MGVWVAQKNGAWWVFAQDRKQGIRRSRKVGTKVDAEKLAREYRQVLNRTALAITGPHGTRTLTDVFEQWLETHAKPNCKPSTYAGYETAWRLWIKPALGEKAIGAIVRADVRQIISTMQEKRKSRPYIKGTLAPLSAVFNRAIEDDIVTKNPALRIMPKHRGEKYQAANPLSAEQLNIVLATAKAKFPAIHPLVMIFARAGLRIGEAVALQVKHINFEQKCLRIERNWVKGTIQTPKSGRARRIDMSDHLASALKEHIASKAPDDLVFPSTSKKSKGKFLDPDNFRHRAWRQLFHEAQVPQRRIHDLRHTFASILLQRGASPVYVMEQMGHHSIQVTVDIYGHLIPGENHVEVNKLDDVPLELTTD